MADTTTKAPKVDARTPTDFAALFGEDVEVKTSLRGNEVDDYPNLINAVQLAHENGRAVLMPPRKVSALPTEDARKLMNLLRQAATKLNVGMSVTLVKDEADEKWSRIRESKESPYTGKEARVRFQPGDRRNFDPDKPRKPVWTGNLTAEQYTERWANYTKAVREWNSAHEVKITPGDKATAPTRKGRRVK